MKNLKVGLFALALLLVGGALFPVFACSMSNMQPYRMSHGMNVYENRLIVLQGVRSGKRLGSYQGVRTQGIDDCVKACINDANCANVTYRKSNGANCLKFGKIDFVTKEKMRPTMPMYVNLHWSALVRPWNAKGNGLCR